MPERLLLEFVKIFNWTDKSLEVRITVGWADSSRILLEETIRGDMQEDCLKFRMAIRIQLSRPSQTLRIQLASGYGKPLGAAELVLQSGMLKHKIHYLTIPNSQNKILQVSVHGEVEARSPNSRDINNECERIVHETMERKISTNIELKRNDIFIKNREKFLTNYSRSRSKSKTKDFPSKINSLLQEVRSIKNAIRLSSSRSSSRVVTRQSQNTPSRLSSLQSIDEQPKFFHRSPNRLPKRSPRRYEPDSRSKFVPISPEHYSEYGIMKTRIPENRTSDRARERQNDRPSYLIHKKY